METVIASWFFHFKVDARCEHCKHTLFIHSNCYSTQNWQLKYLINRIPSFEHEEIHQRLQWFFFAIWQLFNQTNVLNYFETHRLIHSDEKQQQQKTIHWIDWKEMNWSAIIQLKCISISQHLWTHRDWYCFSFSCQRHRSVI